MRVTLNAILAFIGATSLTDPEFDSIDEGLDTGVPQEVYDCLLAIIEDRESVSDFPARLNYYYKAKGYEFVETDGVSNILVGDTLGCD